MKKLFLAVAVVALFASAAQAREVESYVSVKGAWGMPHDSVKFKDDGEKIKITEDVPAIRAAFGIATPIPSGVIRSEIELGYMGSSDEKVFGVEDSYGKYSMKTMSALANVYYDMCTTTAFRPYVGAGIGYARIQGREVWSEGNEGGIERLSGSSLAWQVGAGVGYKITKGWYADLGYRWADYGDKAHNGVKLESKGHEVTFGLRYQF